MPGSTSSRRSSGFLRSLARAEEQGAAASLQQENPFSVEKYREGALLGRGKAAAPASATISVTAAQKWASKAEVRAPPRFKPITVAVSQQV